MQLHSATATTRACTSPTRTPHACRTAHRAQAACAPLSSQETKDLETTLAGIRTDKHKAEQAEAAAKKGTKKQLNVGRTGGTAGLDDYIYDDAPGDDYGGWRCCWWCAVGGGVGW